MANDKQVYIKYNLVKDGSAVIDIVSDSKKDEKIAELKKLGYSPICIDERKIEVHLGVR